jgi:membrane protein DedA with SNARE-associated domain
MLLLGALISPDTIRIWIESGGYFMLFGLLVVCGLGLPLPEDIPLIATGVLVAQGHMHIWIAAPVAWLGILGGDCILYSLGRANGENIIKLPYIGRHFTVERLRKLEGWFEEWGVLVIAIGRMFAGIRAAMVVAAGAIKFNFIKFIITDALAAIVSGGIFLLIGWWFGANLDRMNRLWSEFKVGLTILGVILAAGFAGYLWWRAKRHESVTDVMLNSAERLKKHPHETGHVVGKVAGHLAGQDAGQVAGYDAGYDAGHATGYDAGWAQGAGANGHAAGDGSGAGGGPASAGGLNGEGNRGEGTPGAEGHVEGRGASEETGFTGKR